MGPGTRQHLDLQTWNGTLLKDNIWICTPGLGPGTRKISGFPHLDWDLEHDNIWDLHTWLDWDLKQANTWIYTPGLGLGEWQHLDLHTWNGTWHRTTVLGGGGRCVGEGKEETKKKKRKTQKPFAPQETERKLLRSPVPSTICVRLQCAVVLCYEPSLALHLRGASPSAMSNNQNRASRCVFGNKTKLSHNLSCPRLVLLSLFHLLELPSVLVALFPSPSSSPFPLCLLIFSDFPLSRDYELFSCFLLIGHW